MQLISIPGNPEGMILWDDDNGTGVFLSRDEVKDTQSQISDAIEKAAQEVLSAMLKKKVP